MPEAIESVSRPLRLRARATNSLVAWPGVDGRSADGRRLRDLTEAFADELGGADSLGEAERADVRQAAAMTFQAEKLQAAAMRGEQVSIEQLVRVSNAAGRAVARLGIVKRERSDAGPSLQDIIAEHAAQAGSAA